MFPTSVRAPQSLATIPKCQIAFVYGKTAISFSWRGSLCFIVIHNLITVGGGGEVGEEFLISTTWTGIQIQLCSAEVFSFNLCCDWQQMFSVSLYYI